MSTQSVQDLNVDGLKLASTSAGIRYEGRDDLLVMLLDEGCTVAATFTTNDFAAAPVIVAREHLAQASPRILLINAGNANAGTGEQGMQAARECCEIAANAFGTEAQQVLPFSTGVIGEPMSTQPFAEAMPVLQKSLSAHAWEQAAAAIMTTDTVPKLSTKRAQVAGHDVVVTGIAKGSGMIHPNMATMLAYVATDAAVDQTLLQNILQEAVDHSFNRITVDGDTSTNDACVLIATGAAFRRVLGHDSDEAAIASLREAVEQVCLDLAKQIVRDGEGATKFVEVRVINAKDEREALQVAQTVALSPLVKTALNASDPNWGRILAAVGRAGVEALDVNRIAISIGGEEVAREGAVSSRYSEPRVEAIMLTDEFDIEIDLSRGQAQTSVWTCDLSAEYVRINADYRS